MTLSHIVLLFIVSGDIVVRRNCDGCQSWDAVSGAQVEVKEVRSIKAPYKFMFERMRDTAVALDETICRVADRLIDKYKLVPEVRAIMTCMRLNNVLNLDFRILWISALPILRQVLALGGYSVTLKEDSTPTPWFCTAPWTPAAASPSLLT